jgi:hypothetical protein
MTSRDFCFWLQGYLEIEQADKSKGAAALSYLQVECIQKHLALVFKQEIDPSAGSAKIQKELNHMHHGKKPLMRC